jgi:tetratricopeptide (TPR) repeat protein
MNPHKFSQQCLDKETGRVDTSAMSFAYKFFSTWRPIDYSGVGRYINERAEKHKQQNSISIVDVLTAAKKNLAHDSDKDNDEPENTNFNGNISPTHRVAGMATPKAANLLQNEPSKKDLKNLINVVRDSFHEGLSIYKETENESDDEEIEILLDDCIEKFSKTIKLCERITRKYRSLSNAEDEKQAIYLFFGRALTSKALSYEKISNYNEALNVHKKTIEIYKKLGDDLKTAEQLYNATWCPLNIYLENKNNIEHINASLFFLKESIAIDPNNDKYHLLQQIENLKLGIVSLKRDKGSLHGLCFA